VLAAGYFAASMLSSIIGGPGGSSGATLVEYSTTDKSAGVLSNANKTFTANAAAFRPIRLNSPVSWGQKLYLEVNLDALDAGTNDVQFGLACKAAKLTTYFGNDTNAFVWCKDGRLLYTNTDQHTIQAMAVGTLCMAVDLTAKLIWFRTGAGNWNNSGTANPATGVGGWALPAGFAGNNRGSLFPAVMAYGTATALTINQTPVQAVPAGFNGWPTVNTAHKRFWRLNITADNGNTSNVTLQEVALSESSGGADVTAPGDVVWTNSDLDSFGWSIAGLIDNNTTTGSNHGWASLNNSLMPSPGIYVAVDVGQHRDIVEAKLTARSDAAADSLPRDFTIQSSYDGETWATEKTLSAVSWTLGEVKTYAIP
jgi:hypothetical protein